MTTMEFLQYFLFVLFLNLPWQFIAGEQIIKVNLLNNPKFVVNATLPDHVMRRVSSMSVLLCVKWCLSSNKCSSINFDKITLVCELNTVDDSAVTLTQKTGSWFSRRSAWLDELSEFGECAVLVCPTLYTCIKSAGKATCVRDVPECGAPYEVNNGILVGARGVSVGDINTYSCLGYHISDGAVVSICQADGQWSTPTYSCRHVASCADIKSCRSSYTTDGEYWIYPPAVQNNPVKVYCHDMSTATPKNFVTLYNLNNAYFAFAKQIGCRIQFHTWPKSGTTTYNKICIRPKTMAVIRDSFDFTTTTRTHKVPYGTAESCGLNSRCAALGTMRLDLTGTGLIFNSQMTWKTWGYQPMIDHVTIENNHVITGKCDGICGGCKPATPLKLEIDADYTPDLGSATIVNCG